MKQIIDFFVQLQNREGSGSNDEKKSSADQYQPIMLFDNIILLVSCVFYEGSFLQVPRTEGRQP